MKMKEMNEDEKTILIQDIADRLEQIDKQDLPYIIKASFIFGYIIDRIKKDN